MRVLRRRSHLRTNSRIVHGEESEQPLFELMIGSMAEVEGQRGFGRAPLYRQNCWPFQSPIDRLARK